MGGDARRILVVQALRAFAYGLGSVLIGVTLADLGLSGFQVGLVLSALIAGTAIVSVILARSGDRIGRRRWYVGLLALMAVSGTVFALTDSVWLLVLVALTGTVSTEVVESGPFTSLEQAMLPNAAEGHDPTRLFWHLQHDRDPGWLARRAGCDRHPVGRCRRNGSSSHIPLRLLRRSGRRWAG